MSMMRSNARSEKSEPIIANLVLSKLVNVQRFASGDHSAWIYGFQVSEAAPKPPKLNIHPYCCYDCTRYANKFSRY